MQLSLSSQALSSEALLAQAVELMLAGIGSVFVFLVLLVVATRIMSWALIRFTNAAAHVDVPDVSEPVVPAGQHPPSAHLAAIASAVNRYRKDHRTEKSR